MKLLSATLLFSAFLSANAFALKAEIKDTDAVSYAGTDGVFPNILAMMTFSEQGPVRTGVIRDLHCNQRTDDLFELPLANPQRGLPSLDCYVGSDHKSGSTAGRRVTDAFMYEKIAEGFNFETPPGAKTYFKTSGDHDSLRLNNYDVKSIECQVTLAVTDLGKGRVSCVVDDGRP